MSETEKKLDLHRDHTAGRKILMRFSDELESYFMRQKKRATVYYQTVFGASDGRELIFDCGYSGSVSRGLKRAYGEDKRFDKYYLWEASKNKEIDQEDRTVTFCFFDEQVAVGLNILLEECFSPLCGSCTGFEELDGTIQPILGKFAASVQMQQDMLQIKNDCVQYAEA